MMSKNPIMEKELVSFRKDRYSSIKNPSSEVRFLGFENTGILHRFKEDRYEN